METKPFTSKNSSSLSIDAHRLTDVEATISLQEWQGWGTISPVPWMVNQVIQDLKLLEKDIDAPMTFCGNHGKLSVKNPNFRSYLVNGLLEFCGIDCIGKFVGFYG